MSQLLFVLLYFVSILGYSEQITDYLNVDTSHFSLCTPYLDAAFVVRLDDRSDTGPLIDALEPHGIRALEYNNFNSLSMKTMRAFCSEIVSPYLLTRTLSHLSLYQYCMKNGLKRVLILEDQASVQGDIAKLSLILEKVQQADPSWDIVYTDVDFHQSDTGEHIIPHLAHIPQNKDRIDETVSKLRYRYGTVSYVISERGMKKILQYFSRRWDNLPYDQVLFTIPHMRIFTANEDIITNKYSNRNLEKSTHNPVQIERSYEIGEEHWVDPASLLGFDRMDIIPNYIYARYWINDYKTSWHVDLYKSYLKASMAFSNGKSPEILQDQFLNRFCELISSIKNGGYNPKYAIDMNAMHIPSNGTQRIATSLALGNQIKVRIIDGQSLRGATCDIFRHKYHLDEKFIDHMALEYAKLKKNTYIVCLYPQATDKQLEAEKILKKHGTIIHSKKLSLSETGLLEFIRLVYTGEWWTGSYKDDFKHCRGKVLLAFPHGPQPVHIYLYECADQLATIEAKREIRQICNVGAQAVHINDTHSQTVKIAQTLFNKNSLDFINQRSIQGCRQFEAQLDDMLQSLQAKKLDLENICIGKNGTEAAYGIRPCDALDILYRGTDGALDDLLFNPTNHFYYNGLKFTRKCSSDMK